MLNSFFFIFFFITNTCIIILFILLGGIIPLVERKVLSLTHRRVGPKIIGFKGKFQFLADAFKLLIKEFFLPKKTNKFFFFLLPIFLLNLNLFLTFNIIWFSNVVFCYTEYALLFLIIIELLNCIFLFFIGYFSKNKYTFLSSSRVFNSFFVLELISSFFFVFVYILNNSFSFSFFNTINSSFFSLLNLPLLVPFFFLNFLIFLKKVPFDFIEAETEIIMGYHVEHSGFLAGALILIEYVHLFFWIFFFINIVF